VDDEAARIPGVAVGRRMNGVVVVARIDGIDGDEVKRAQVGAAVELRRLEPLQLGQHGRREVVRDAVGVNGDQADLALLPRVPQHLDDARLRHAEAMGAGKLEADEVAVSGAAHVALRDRPLPQLPAVHRIDDAAARRLGAEDPELAALLARQALDGLGLVAVAGDVDAVEPRQAGQHPVALPERRLAGAGRAARRQHQGTRALALGLVPGHRLADELAVGVARDDLEHRHRRQASPLLEALAVAGEQSLVRHLRQQLLERHAVAALDGEGARDLALAGLGVRIAQVVEDVLLARQAGGAAGFFGFAGHRGFKTLAYSAASRVPATLLLPLALAFGGSLAWGLAADFACLAEAFVSAGRSAPLASRAEASPLPAPLPRRALGLEGPLARRSAMSCTASSMVSAAGSLLRGSVALTSPCLT